MFGSYASAMFGNSLITEISKISCLNLNEKDMIMILFLITETFFYLKCMPLESM